jgi:hypothetical protein
LIEKRSRRLEPSWRGRAKIADLASLIVRLEAETSQYSAAIQKATDQISGFADTVGSSVADVAKNLLGLEALKQVFDFSDNIVKTMASFDLLSHAVGATTETLSQLSFAGKLTGVDDIGAALEKMARSVGQAEIGNQKLIGTFSALGVSITDASGKLKSTDQQLLDIADAVSKYNDGLSKTAAVQAIFGRGGADFIKFLDQGAEAIKAAQQEAIDLGVSISAPAAKAADEFESNMTRIGAAFQGVFFKALEEVLPKFIEITDKIVEFAKNADNTRPIVEQLAAGFKIIGTVLVIVGTAFEVVGKVIGQFVGSIVLTIEALADLANAFTDPIGAMQKFAKEQVGVIEQISNAFAHPADTAKKFVSDTQDALDGIDNVLEHPIDSIKKFFQTQKDAVSSGPTSDVLSTLKAGLSALNAMWGDANDQLNEIHITAKKIKPDLVLIDNTALKAMESAIDALAKLDDTLKQQVATYGLSGAAATVYDVTLGKLSASVDKVDNLSPKQAQAALAALEKQGKLSKAAIDEINASIAAGVPIGDAFKKSIIDEATALDQLKAVDALSKLDAQLLTMTGHLEDAGKAAFDLANRPLRVTIQTQQDKTTFKGLDNSQSVALATSQLNDLKSQAITINDALGKKIADVDAAALASGEGNLQVAGEEAVARQAAISQLEALYVKAQALAEATGMKSAAEQAKALQSAIGAIQFNPKIVQDVDAATAAQKKFTEATLVQKKADDDLSLQMADLAKQNADGSLTDLDYMAKQDDARQKAIDQLTVIQGQYLDLYNNNPGNAAALDQYKRLGIQIDGLQTQMGQLAKTVRTDLTDSLTNAFVGFATGSESASAALKSFVADFSKQMLQLAAKQLFQKLFESTGISAGIDSLFGAATKTAGSAASGAAIGTAITTAATAGGATMGGALEASGTLAATAMGTAIEAAGTAAAAEMAAAIAGSGAASGASAATVVALAAAGGGPIPANQLTLVGELGPELYVSDLGETTAATATKSGTQIPDDLMHAHVIGTNGPEYIKPNVSGFVVPSDTFLKALADRAAPRALQPIHAAPDDVKAEQAEPDGGHRGVTQAAAGIRPPAPVVDLMPLIAARLPALQTRLFAPPQTTAAERVEQPAGHAADVSAPIRTTVESRGAPSIQLPSPPSNVIAFPTPTMPASGHAMAKTLDVASELPSIPDRLDAEVTRADAPEVPAMLDEPTSAMIIKFEKIVKNEQPPMLDPYEYEALLTDRYLQKRQGGGPVSAGKPYLVGEGGPELMVPDSSGTVMNSWQTQNNQPSTIVNVNNHFLVQSQTGKVDRASQGQIAAKTGMSVQMALARNG